MSEIAVYTRWTRDSYACDLRAHMKCNIICAYCTRFSVGAKYFETELRLTEPVTAARTKRRAITLDFNLRPPGRISASGMISVRLC